MNLLEPSSCQHATALLLDIHRGTAPNLSLVAAAEDIALHLGVTLNSNGGIAKRLTLVAAAVDVAFALVSRTLSAYRAVAVDGECDVASDVAEVGKCNGGAES